MGLLSVLLLLLLLLLLLYAYEYVQQGHESGGVSATRPSIADSTPGSVCGFGVRGLPGVSLSCLSFWMGSYFLRGWTKCPSLRALGGPSCLLLSLALSVVSCPCCC